MNIYASLAFLANLLFFAAHAGASEIYYSDQIRTLQDEIGAMNAKISQTSFNMYTISDPIARTRVENDVKDMRKDLKILQKQLQQFQEIQGRRQIAAKPVDDGLVINKGIGVATFVMAVAFSVTANNVKNRILMVLLASMGGIFTAVTIFIFQH